MKTKYQCPCCGQFTLESSPGTYDICPICGWEDDPVQFEQPEYADGANRISLLQARREWRLNS